MNRPNDIRIEAFRETMERLTLIPGALQTLAITLHRADELPGIMERCSCRLDATRLREEQAAIGDQLRAAIDAAVGWMPFVRFHSPGGTWRNWRCTGPCRPRQAQPDDLYSSGRHGWR